MKYNQLKIKKNSLNFRDDLFENFYIDDVCDSNSSFLIKMLIKLIVLNRHHLKQRSIKVLKKKSNQFIIRFSFHYRSHLWQFHFHFHHVLFFNDNVNFVLIWLTFRFFPELSSSSWLISNSNSFISVFRFFVLRRLL